ncbi:calcium-binding protein [Profundibacter sp.]
MTGFNYIAVFQSDAWAYLNGISSFQLVPDGGGYRLYGGSGSYGGIIGFTLTAGAAASHIGDWLVDDGGNSFRLSDFTMVGGDLLVAELGSSHLERYNFSTSGSLINPAPVSYSGNTPSLTPQIVSISVGTTTFVATGGGAGGPEGLNIYEVQGGTLIHTDTVMDDIKVTVGDIADLVTVTVNGTDYLVVGSTRDSGISTFTIDASGHTHLVDAIGQKEGLWLSGLDSLAATEANGTSYIIVASTLSGSLSVVRINPMGVMFVTDHVTDTLGTRFDNVDAIDSFTVNGRGFVIAGGSDDGLTLLEIMPDGRLLEHDSIENQNGWTLENITAIQTAVFDGEVQVFAAGSRMSGIMQFTIPTDALATPINGDSGNNTLSGTALDDLIYGGAGNDTLHGNGGDDILFGGDRLDQLYGGAGADVFIIDSGPDQDQIRDFELGLDRIDLSRWGMVYDPSDLTITSHTGGATVQFGDLSLDIRTDDGSILTAADLTADSFIF